MRLLLLLLSVCLCLPSHARMSIRFIGPLTEDARVLGAAQRAGAQWSGRITSPVTVTVSLAVATNYPANLYATGSPYRVYPGYGEVREAMAARGISLPETLPATLPKGFSHTGKVEAAKANLKALGWADLDAVHGLSDGTITINGNINYDYDNRDGVGIATLDLESLLAHELGHILGYDSVVDEIEALRRVGMAAPVSATIMDLSRFSVGYAPASPEEFTTAPRHLDSGPAMLSDGRTAYPLSGGIYTGDGWSAGHWKYGTSVGVMGPALAYERIVRVTDADIWGLERMGWSVRRAASPEPGSLCLLSLALLFVLGRRFRQ